MRSAHFGCLTLIALFSCAGAALALEGEDPKDVIAAQLRDQGYACDKPQSATRDENASGPDEAAWIVACEGASYRVKLIPDMAAKVEKIDQKDQKQDDQSGQDD
jgi:hypothetical protein